MAPCTTDRGGDEGTPQTCRPSYSCGHGINVRGVTEFPAALAGALVGGGATFYASWWQTKRVLEHKTKQARDAVNDERKAARHSVSRWAVVELLGLLSDVERAVPHLARAVGRPGLMPTEMQARVEEVTDALDASVARRPRRCLSCRPGAEAVGTLANGRRRPSRRTPGSNGRSRPSRPDRAEDRPQGMMSRPTSGTCARLSWRSSTRRSSRRRCAALPSARR
jgi:hypothetical protein